MQNPQYPSPASPYAIYHMTRGVLVLATVHDGIQNPQ
jgi:hypothetical protein